MKQNLKQKKETQPAVTDEVLGTGTLLLLLMMLGDNAAHWREHEQQKHLDPAQLREGGVPTPEKLRAIQSLQLAPVFGAYYAFPIIR